MRADQLRMSIVGAADVNRIFKISKLDLSHALYLETLGILSSCDKKIGSTTLATRRVSLAKWEPRRSFR